MELPVLEHHQFHRLTEAQDMGGRNAYFEPDHSNFAVLDALIRCEGGCGPLSSYIGLQATTALEHPISMSRLKNHLKDLGDPARFDLVFVVPERIFGTFRYQRYHTTKNKQAASAGQTLSATVRQWVLELPVGPSIPPRVMDPKLVAAV